MTMSQIPDAGSPKPDRGGPGPNRPLTFFDVLLPCAVASTIVLLPIVALVTTAARNPELEGLSMPLATMALLLLEPIAIFGGLFFVLILARRFTWADLGLRPVALHWIGPAVLSALGCLAFAGAVSQVLERFGAPPMMQDYVALLAPGGLSWQRAVALVVVVGVLVPLAEEVLFRGVLYAWLRQRWGVATSALVSAGLFALAHGNARMAVQIFVTGIVLAVLYERSRSVLTSALTHMTVNTVSLVIIFSYAGLGTGSP